MLQSPAVGRIPGRVRRFAVAAALPIALAAGLGAGLVPDEAAAAHCQEIEFIEETFPGRVQEDEGCPLPWIDPHGGD